LDTHHNSELKKNDAWGAAWDSVKNDVPQFRMAVETEFRMLLGSDYRTSKQAHRANIQLLRSASQLTAAHA